MRVLSALALVLGMVALTIAGEFEPTSRPVDSNGTRVLCDLPTSQHHKNVGGSDGAGLCVYTSAWHAALWQRIEGLYGFRDWMRRRPGGAWPEKFDKTMKQFCTETGVPVPEYIQHTGGDEDVLDLALKTGRMVSVTYAGRDDFYRSRVAHMVNLVYLDRAKACILDNNRPGVFLWMSRAAFLSRWRDMGGGWCFVFLASPPAPHPTPPTEILGDEVPEETVFGQCGPGGCRLPSVPASTSSTPIGSPPTPDHEWGEIPGVGMGWRFRQVLTGVDEEKLRDGGPIYTLNGQAATKADALNAMARGLVDGSNRWTLIVSGDSSFEARVRTDVARLSAEDREKLHVVTYRPGDWQVSHFAIADGVTLRKPATITNGVRVGADLGRVPAAEYSDARLTALIECPGGPRPRNNPSPDQPSPNGPVQPQSPWMALAAVIVALVTALRGKA